MTKTQAAIVGTGFMGWVHLEALRRIGIPVVGVLGSSADKSRQMADRHAVSTAYRDYAELLDDAAVQAVHIVTPNKLHFEMVRQALAAGKHVMCEKPLAMNSAESAQLVQLAENAPQLATAVNYNIRFYPLCIEAGERLRSGSLGNVLHITGSYLQDWLLKSTDYNWRVLAEEGGSLRAVADIGTHWLDLVQSISGLRVEAVCADLATVHPIRQRPVGEVETFQAKQTANSATEAISITTEDHASVLLRFSGGARGSLTVSQVSAGRKNCLRFEIAGDKQALAWNSEQPNQLWLGHRDRANEMLLRDPALLGQASRLATDYPGGHNEGYDDSFKQSFRAFYRYIDQGDFTASPPFATFRDGHREVLLCEAILRSHRTKGWVHVGEDRE